MPALRPTSLALAPLAAALLVACTDTQLFRDDGTLYEADRLTLRGRVCAEDTRQATLPTRVVLIVDQATGPLFADYDPGATRVPLLRSFIQSRLADPDVPGRVARIPSKTTVIPRRASRRGREISCRPILSKIG